MNGFTVSSASIYDQNLITLKQYGKKYKLTYHKFPVRQSGWELDDEYKKESLVPKSEPLYDSKLSNSISRSRATVFELAMCNDWDWFCTLTINSAKHDRYCLDPYYKEFAHWLRNFAKYHEFSLKYLLIPELHKDGAWHMHGLFSGLPVESLIHFKDYHDKKRKLPPYILDKLSNSEDIYSFEPYEKKFGFCTFEAIRNPEAASKYITKYVSKEMGSNGIALNKRLYYCSKGLQYATVIKKGSLAATNDPVAWDFENDYVCFSWSDSPNDFLELFVPTPSPQCNLILP